MGSESNGKEIIRGCSFLVEDHSLDRIFTPEDLEEEHLMIGQLAEDFVEGSVRPKQDAVESMEEGLMASLMKEAGELGLLGIDVPEEYGGFDQIKAVTMLVAEKISRSGSFQVAQGAHSGIGTLPIAYFGTKEQKDKYLEGLGNGSLLGAYALTEAGSGSDATAARSTAVLTEDGKHYVLNGEKMFLTNAAFADVFTVFAQVDGKEFTAFILEKGMEGLSTGAEEKKMGIKGSSTRTLIMEDVKVSVENVLGEVGKGAQIAFNILNVGRFKLGAGATGGSIHAMLEAVRYGKQRHQFGKPITDFGMIKHKIGEMASRIYAARSMVYRGAGCIDQNIATLDRTDEDFYHKMIDIGIREYMTECSIMKVFCSEVLDYCVDECVQIHGGYGFVSEYPAERYYRDARINRLYEGTNEINRLIIAGDVLRKASKNELPIFARAKALVEELMGMPSLDGDADDSFLAPERKTVSQAKKTVLLALGTVARERGDKLRDVEANQEIFGFLADLIMDAYAMESALLRTLKMKENGVEGEVLDVAADMTRLYCNEALHRMEITARNVLAAVCDGDILMTTLAGLRRTVKHQPADTVALRRAVADAIIEKEDWPI